MTSRYRGEVVGYRVRLPGAKTSSGLPLYLGNSRYEHERVTAHKPWSTLFATRDEAVRARDLNNYWTENAAIVAVVRITRRRKAGAS